MLPYRAAQGCSRTENSTDTIAKKYLIPLKSFGGQAILLYSVAVGQLADLGHAQ
jgi:hypothetical protein